jgi:hypothetical protein
MQETKAPKPESLEAKFKLMTMLPFDRRAKRKHILVYGFILDWYHTKYGDALASVRHIVATLKERDPFEAGLFTGDVHVALTDLVAWGYLTQEKGAGRRASRYVPVWEKARSVQKTPNATEDNSSVQENPNTCVRENQNATADSVQGIPNEDPLTGPGLRTGSHVVGNEFSEPATPPPAAGLTATAAGSAEGEGDGFSEFWKVWPRKHGIKRAQAEWKKILTDVDIIIEVAGDWAAYYAKHDVDKKWIPEPANWLKDERWKEDLPIVHADAKGAAIAKAKANAPLKNAQKTGPRTVDIIKAEVDQSTYGKTFLSLTFCERDTPTTWDHIIAVEHPDVNVQSDGLKEFKELCDAVTLPHLQDSAEFEGRSLRVLKTAKGGLEYLPDPSEDKLREAA